MNIESSQKVTAGHLKRAAYLYVRQSTMRQVFENTESTERQYGLRQRAIALGWPSDRVIVIDSDLGHSGASAVDRAGFQKLVAEVGMGRAGIVLGLEVSRLARNSADWHRLLEICALTDTLILDEDGLYDPAHFNDRLLLGLKGTMSEAELHILRARLRGGLLNKARRGELHCGSLPAGLIYDARGFVALDPDRQVQETVRLLFHTFARTGTLRAAVKHFRQQGLLFPKRAAAGPQKGRLVWVHLSLGRASTVLHNPFYAGAYAFGRSRYRKQPDGGYRHEHLPQDEWQVLIRDAHPGYISWQEYEGNLQRLRASAKALGFERDAGPAREGPALLQGRVVCGLCGSRMHVHYNVRRNGPITNYVCAGRTRQYGDPLCQSILGTGIDAAVGKLLVEAVTPITLDLALAVQQEIAARLEEADRLRHRQVERAQYEADLARQRYMQVDPANRLVADALEADWNVRLRALAEAQEEYQRRRATDCLVVDDAERKRILALATDFPAIWNHPQTPQRERKRMLGFLIEDVTLIKQREITAAVRFRGGATTTLTLPRPLTAQQLRATHEPVRMQIDELLEEYTDSQVARILNEQKLRTGAGDSFNTASIKWIRFSANIKSLKERLLESGWLTVKEVSARLGLSRSSICKLRLRGKLQGRMCNDHGQWLYWLPEPMTNDPVKQYTCVNSTVGDAI